MLETIVTLETHLANAAAGTERIQALIALVWGLRAVEPLRALSLSEEAVSLARAAGDLPRLAPSLCLLGVSAVILSRHDEARQALEESLALSRRLGDRFTEARCLHYLGVIHCSLAEHAQAVENVTAALQIFEALEDGEWLGAGYNILGNVQFSSV